MPMSHHDLFLGSKYYLLKQLNGLAHNTSLSSKLANEPQKLAFIFSLNHEFGFYSVPAKAALFQPDKLMLY
jgi:hypothetical protein